MIIWKERIMTKSTKSYQDHLIESLKDPNEAAAYLNAAIEEDSPEIFLLALRNVAEAHGFTKLSRSSKLNRESMYRMLSEKGNPKLSSLSSLLKSIGLKFAVEVVKIMNPDWSAVFHLCFSNLLKKISVVLPRGCLLAPELDPALRVCLEQSLQY